jgi:nitroreductase
MDLREAIESRRSVHDYTDESLDDDTIETIFERVRYTPSGFNLQPWEFLVVREAENRERLQECANGQDHVTDAPAGIVILGNLDPAAHAERNFDDWLDKGYLPDEETRNGLIETVEGWREWPEEEKRVWTTRSTALAAMTLMYAAWDEGVATCPMEGFDSEAITEEFGIEGYEPVIVMTMGYPEEDANDIETERKIRRPVEEIVHEESFDV